MNKTLKYCFFIVLLLIIGCNRNETVSDKVTQPSVGTVHPTRGYIREKKQLNGLVLYLNKTTITAPVSGYVTQVNTDIGNWVKKDELLFKIQTRESSALQNSNVSTPGQFGVMPVFASVSGFINILNVTDPNVFITEGNAMATIVKNSDLVIQVNAPYEDAKLLSDQRSIEIELPNNEVLGAVFYKEIPLVDPISQTQQILFKLKKYTTLPENLNVHVSFLIKENSESLLLPKEAVMTNETQDEFWIMKVTKDSLAIQVPVIKGIENDDKIEILNPSIDVSDEIIVTGGYELPDSTKVNMNEE